MPRQQEKMKSPQLRFLIVGNASCFHGADHFAIPPLYMCRHINQSNVSLMSGICLLFCSFTSAASAEVPSLFCSRRPNSPGATSGLVSLTPTVWVAVETGGGGRWMVGLAAHWARGLAHLGLATHRPCAAAACSWQEGRARAGAAEAA